MSNLINEDENESFLNSDKVVSIINLLNKYKIKLWELTDLNQPESQSQVEDLLMKLSDESGLIEEELKNILIKLQKHSLKKLEENKKFNNEGLATFKIKIIGNTNQKQPSVFSDSLEISIKQTGAELENFLIKNYNLTCDHLKIICNGKVVKDDQFLSSQEIKNHSTLMIMCVYKQTLDKLAQNSQDYKLISDIKDAVNLLTDNNMKYLNLTRDLKLQNQNGVSIDMNESDQRCLTTAMILHEKSKNLIKSKEYLKALILLAESDNEFKACSDRSFLERIDNYALLNLDIIWCYLNLENLHELKNAEERIQLCEKALQKCYGSDLSRLSSIKSESANKHTTIFVRLNLLKAILNYHKGKKGECKHYLDIASTEMKKITIDEDKLTQVMSMGFSITEARLALRATYNDVDAAVEQIFKKKKILKEAKVLEKEKEYAKKLESKYGRTLDGNKPIDIKVLNDLIQFGYSEKRAARALIRGNNDFNLALDLLQAVEDDFDDGDFNGNDGIKLSNDMILSQLKTMGYDLDMCKLCLNAFGNNYEKVMNFFLENKPDSSNIKEKLQEMIDKEACIPTTSKQSMKQDLEKAMNAQNLLNNLAEEMPDDDEAYLDLNIDEDVFFIKKYYSLLEV